MKFLDIEMSETILKKIIVFFVIICFVFIACTMSSLLVFKSYTIGENTSINDEDIRTHIDLLAHDNKKIEITGWAYKEGQEIKTCNSHFVLKHQETGKMYLMRTQMEKNESIKDIGCQLGGLHAQCLLLGMKKGVYDIYVLYQNDGEDILSFTLISVEI